MTVGELEVRMSGSELAEWMVYYAAEPFGTFRDNVHAGLIAATLANIHRKKGTKPLTFNDFMLQDPSHARRRSTREALTWFKSVAKKHGKK